MAFKPRGADIHVESRARDQARFLIRDHGDRAESVLDVKRQRPNVSASDLYRYDLTMKEITKLRRRMKREAEGEFFLFAWLRRLFRGKRRRRR